MKKRVMLNLFIVFLISLSATSFADNNRITLEDKITGRYHEEFVDVVDADGSSYITIGYTQSFKNQNPNIHDTYRYRSILRKYDNSGDLIWENILSEKDSTRVFHIEKYNDEYFVLWATIEKVESLIVINKDGEVVNRYFYPELEFIGVKDIIVNSNGEILVLGMYREQDSETYQIEYHGEIIKFDINGLELSRLVFKEKEKYIPTDFELTKDGHFLVAGSTIIRENSDGVLIKMTQSGEIIWEHTMELQHWDSYLEVSELQNGDYFLLGFSNSAVGIFENYDECTYYEILDTDGKSKGIKPVSNLHSPQTVIKMTPNGGFVLGYFYEEVKGDHDTFIVEFDALAKEIYREKIDGFGMDRIYAIEQIGNGDFIAVGRKEDVDKHNDFYMHYNDGVIYNIPNYIPETCTFVEQEIN